MMSMQIYRLYKKIPGKSGVIERVFRHQVPKFLDHQSSLVLSLSDTQTVPTQDEARSVESPAVVDYCTDHKPRTVIPHNARFPERNSSDTLRKGISPCPSCEL